MRKSSIFLVIGIVASISFLVILFAPEERSLTQTSLSNLSEIDVAVQYRYVTDGGVINRSVDDVIKIFKKVKASFVFQGWLTERPCPDKCS